ncbi:flavin reductase family protein [Streptomyces gobiensis]|uniref:flavin reductase family protein n=1 Tax=Streptomyces gobiensis TaxID=2875706 RepID=UPI001E43FE2D|nr:flavin reductase family protein [Streptomyces gobiensis]UGY94318.1 flavin reductase family protein [Streptomyces gobiensis]
MTASSGDAGAGIRADAHISPTRLRHALGRFASGVTVVTTSTGDHGDPDAHGMTANSFTSVSLHPPLVLVSVATEAVTHQRIAESGRYGISILSGDQKPLSEHFAGGAQRPELVRFVWRQELPMLAGALVHLMCTVRQAHLAGDHTVYIGEVDGLWSGPGSPLVNYRKQFHTLDVLCQDGSPGPARRGGLLSNGKTGRSTHG